MKKRFHEGEEVVCIDKEMKPLRPCSCIAPSLPYNSLQTILSYDDYHGGRWWVTVVGAPPGSVYSEDSFDKLLTMEELIEEYGEQLEEAFESTE